MALADPVVMPLAYEMLACLEQEVDKVEFPPLHRGLRPGSIIVPWLSTTDDECCSGLAWVRPALFVPNSTQFPLQDDAPVKGGPLSWAITLELGVVRCAPTPDENSMPTPDEWNELVQKIMDDAAAMRRAICCFIAADPIRRNGYVLPLQWEPLDVEGRCAGGTLQVVVRGPACDCADAGGS